MFRLPELLHEDRLLYVGGQSSGKDGYKIQEVATLNLSDCQITEINSAVGFIARQSSVGAGMMPSEIVSRLARSGFAGFVAKDGMVAVWIVLIVKDNPTPATYRVRVNTKPHQLIRLAQCAQTANA